MTKRKWEPKTVESRPAISCGADPIEAHIPCKHGKRFRCDNCGTGDGDSVHTTVGGKGKIAKLRGR